MRTGRGAAAGIVVLAALEAACGLSIHHVADPSAAFAEARAQADRDQRRPGRAHRINVLAFDADERKLVRVSLPIWLASKFERHIDLGEGGRDPREGSLGRNLARRVRLRDLAAAGRGLIADVEDDDGQVIVWLR
jgi:hypothetical protein